jgi:hypothetical protein
MLPKLIRLVITVSAAQILPRLKQYTGTLDETAPKQPPRANNQPGRLMPGGFKGVLIDGFVAMMEKLGYHLSIAWYEPKQVKTRSGEMTLHNLVYIWVRGDAVCNRHFHGVRPALRQELVDFLAAHILDVHSWYDNQHCDKETGQPTGEQRWDITLNNCCDLNRSKPEVQLPFPQAAEATR